MTVSTGSRPSGLGSACPAAEMGAAMIRGFEMTTAERLTELAQSLYDAFERAERDDGTTFYRLKDGSPQWMTDAVREAHDGGNIFPNDWIYDACDTMAGHMANSDPDQWDDYFHEWADSAVDCYNSDRAKWLASHLAFGGIVDDAVEELGHSDQGVYGDIGIGQYQLLRDIAGAMIQAVRAQAEEDDAA